MDSNTWVMMWFIFVAVGYLAHLLTPPHGEWLRTWFRVGLGWLHALRRSEPRRSEPWLSPQHQKRHWLRCPDCNPFLEIPTSPPQSEPTTGRGSGQSEQPGASPAIGVWPRAKRENEE